MKVFSMNDTDGGRSAIVIADNMQDAILLYKERHQTFPEQVRDMTADGEDVLMKGLY